jgi:predicted membrane channel-forming protein YqfA (hemolysin III family)
VACIIIVISPVLAGLALHFLAGVSSLSLLAAGAVAVAVGCIFFVTKEDEYLAALWIGVCLLLAVLVSRLSGNLDSLAAHQRYLRRQLLNHVVQPVRRKARDEATRSGRWNLSTLKRPSSAIWWLAPVGT